MKLVLIDRDGVINEELPHYVKTVEELIIPEFAYEGLALLKRRGFACVVITNQSVVGRGIIEQATLDRIHRHMCDTVKARGGEISDVIACTDIPDRATYRRKPKPGMLLEAMEKYGAFPASTPFIGDAVTDLQAAAAAGCQRYLVMTGKGKMTLAALPEELKPVTQCAHLLEAAHLITQFTDNPMLPRWLITFLALCIFLFLLWGAGLVWFIGLMPSGQEEDARDTDAIVVLTGGGLRLERGFELLAEGRARKMFVSGVEDGITLASLMRNKDYRPYAERIPPGSVTLGYWARSTVGNAEETAGWMAHEQVKSIRLVTGNYHMPRSIYELRAVMPEIIIVPEPVFPSYFAHNAWWQSAGSIRLVISEYHKFMASVIVHRLLVKS